MPNLNFQVLSYIITGGIHMYTLISKLFTMSQRNHDDFATLASANVRGDISLYLASYFRFARSSNAPLYSLQSRLIVTVIGINKAGMPVQHESLALWVFDKITLQQHEFVIERMPSRRNYISRLLLFSQFPSSEEVLNSIERAVRNMRSMTTQAADSLFAAIKAEAKAEEETLPLLPLINEPLETSYPPNASTPPTTLIDIVTSNLARAVAVARTGSQSISPQSLAEDSISGYPPQSLLPNNCIRQFRPVDLSFFDVVLLADIVHRNAPIYGLFDNHCYMFSSVIFDAIVKLYHLPASSLDPNNPSASTSYPPVAARSPTIEVGAPKNANLVIVPMGDEDQAGRWSGLLILDPIVKSTIVRLVVSQFRAERDDYIVDVAA
jgi:hypothetical protein